MRPFGMEFLEEIDLPASVTGAQNCHTIWSSLKGGSGGGTVDDADGTSDKDPCGEDPPFNN